MWFAGPEIHELGLSDVRFALLSHHFSIKEGVLILGNGGSFFSIKHIASGLSLSDLMLVVERAVNQVKSTAFPVLIFQATVRKATRSKFYQSMSTSQ
jgi:hypothetical protein